MKTKIDFKELEKKQTSELVELKNKIQLRILESNSPKHKGEKGFNIKEQKKNIARIETILNKRGGA